MKCYVLGTLINNVDVEILDQPVKIDLKLANGMVGVLPIFDSIETLREYAGDGDYQIIPIDIEKET